MAEGVEGVKAEGEESSSILCWHSESWRKGAIFSFSFGFRIFRGNTFKPCVDDQEPHPLPEGAVGEEALEHVVDDNEIGRAHV